MALNPTNDPAPTDTPSQHLTGGRRLVRGVAFNALGQILPLATALLCVPLLVGGLGTDRYGVLSLALAVIGYFSLFDLGLGRALTQFVAQRLGSDDVADLPTGIWTALALMLAFGVIGGVILALIAPWLVTHALGIPPNLQGETLAAIGWIAATIPAVTLAAGFRGALEAYQRFGWINAVRIPLGILTFAGPVAMLPFSNDLRAVVIVIAACIYGSTLAFATLSLRLIPALRREIRIAPRLLGPLLRFGTWMTLSNVVGPLMVYMDRFLIGGLLTVSAVTYYTTSYDAVTRLWVVPAALGPVLFPAFATLSTARGDRAGALVWRGVRVVFVTLFPVTLMVVALAHALLAIWLGDDFALRSTRVLQILAIGVLINSMAHIPFALVQGYGRADWTAKLHVAELPFYLLAVWLLIDHLGIVGAAIAWTLRVAVDTGILFVMCGRLLGAYKLRPDRRQTSFMVCGLLVLVAACFLPGLVAQMLLLAVCIPAFAILAWRVFLSQEERQFTLGFLRRGCAAPAIDGGGNRAPPSSRPDAFKNPSV